MRLLACLTALLITSRAFADDAACIAASEQSLTLRQQGKLHDALKQLSLCADTACPTEVKDECAKRIADIDAATPSIIFAAKDLAGNDVDAVTVAMDGAPFLGSLDGRPATIDPGEHTFRFEMRGFPPVEKKLVIREGEKDRRESVVIQFAPPEPPRFWSAQRLLAVTSGGAGLVGIGLGASFGAFAISIQSQEQHDCPRAGCQHYLQAQTDYDYAQRNAAASTVAFIAGGVLVAAGVVLWLTAPKTPKPTKTAWMKAAPSGVILGGSF